MASRSLCTYSAVVDVAPLFQLVFQQVSRLGVEALRPAETHSSAKDSRISSSHNSMNIHRVSKRERKQLQQLNSNRLEFGVLLLCEFWAVCLSASELLPSCAAPTKAQLAKKGKQAMISAHRASQIGDAAQASQLSVGLLGWEALQAIVDTVCGLVLQANFAATMSYGESGDDLSTAGSAGADDPSDAALSLSFSTSTWRLLVGLLALVTGPVVLQYQTHSEKEVAEHQQLVASLLGAGECCEHSGFI